MQSINLIPQGVDEFGRYMAEGFDDRELISVSTFFQSIFGNPQNGGVSHFSSSALTVDIDIIRGNEKTAALTPRGSNSRILSTKKSLSEGKYSSFSRKFPLAEEEGDISADELNFRQFNEAPYAGADQQSRLRMLAQRIHFESIRRSIRMFERLAAFSVLQGIQPALGWEVTGENIYDFQRNSNNSLIPGVSWNDTNPTIFADMDAICEQIRINGHMTADAALMGEGMFDAYINDPDVLAAADNRRFQVTEVSIDRPVPAQYQRFVDAGLQFRGIVVTPKGYKLHIFTYVDVYTDESGTPRKYMPNDEVLIFSSQARSDRYFGPGEKLPMVAQRAELYSQYFGFNPNAAPMPQGVKNPGAVVLPEMFHCDAYFAQNWKNVSIRTQSAPIFATTAVDGFGRIYNGLI